MSTAVLTPPKLLTAEEFIQRYEDEPVELEKGLVVENAVPSLLHGLVCGKLVRFLGNYIEERELGRVFTNDSWIKTRRSPDSVRGPDVQYISYERLPQGTVPGGLLDVIPELVVEVRSPSDSWNKMLKKSSEYIDTGVKVVVVIDPEQAAATIFRADELPQTLHNGDPLTLPDLFPGFTVPLAQLFR